MRDIHLPAPVSWWPLAPGWWGLLILSVLMIGLAIWAWRSRRRATVKKLALLELARIVESGGDARLRLQELTILVRRAAMSAYPRDQVAGLTGEAWLEFLDRHLGDQRFTQGPGRLLSEAPYRREMPGEVEALESLCREWLMKLPSGDKQRAASPP